MLAKFADLRLRIADRHARQLLDDYGGSRGIDGAAGVGEVPGRWLMPAALQPIIEAAAGCVPVARLAKFAPAAQEACYRPGLATAPATGVVHAQQGKFAQHAILALVIFDKFHGGAVGTQEIADGNVEHRHGSGAEDWVLSFRPSPKIQAQVGVDVIDGDDAPRGQRGRAYLHFHADRHRAVLRYRHGAHAVGGGERQGAVALLAAVGIKPRRRIVETMPTELIVFFQLWAQHFGALARLVYELGFGFQHAFEAQTLGVVPAAPIAIVHCFPDAAICFGLVGPSRSDLVARLSYASEQLTEQRGIFHPWDELARSWARLTTAALAEQD